MLLSIFSGSTRRGHSLLRLTRMKINRRSVRTDAFKDPVCWLTARTLFLRNDLDFRQSRLEPRRQPQAPAPFWRHRDERDRRLSPQQPSWLQQGLRPCEEHRFGQLQPASKFSCYLFLFLKCLPDPVQLLLFFLTYPSINCDQFLKNSSMLRVMTGKLQSRFSLQNPAMSLQHPRSRNPGGLLLHILAPNRHISGCNPGFCKILAHSLPLGVMAFTIRVRHFQHKGSHHVEQ